MAGRAVSAICTTISATSPMASNARARVRPRKARSATSSVVVGGREIGSVGCVIDCSPTPANSRAHLLHLGAHPVERFLGQRHVAKPLAQLLPLIGLLRLQAR